jgi:Ubiquitin-activating enzyme E1 FCCH domain
VIIDTSGLFGYIFTDFGKNFTVGDATGENPVNGIIADIDEEGLVSALDETRHGLEDGDFVEFSEVREMTDLNGVAPRKVTVKGPHSFSIGDVSGLGSYGGGGLFTQVKIRLGHRSPECDSPFNGITLQSRRSDADDSPHVVFRFSTRTNATLPSRQHTTACPRSM